MELFAIVGQLMGSDHDEKVQAACCDFLAKLFEEDSESIRNHAIDVIRIFPKLLQNTKNLDLISSVYSFLSVIATNMDPENQSCGGRISEFILTRWQEFPSRDQEVIKLLECTNSILGTFGENSNNLAKPFIQKILEIFHSSAEKRNVFISP